MHTFYTMPQNLQNESHRGAWNSSAQLLNKQSINITLERYSLCITLRARTASSRSWKCTNAKSRIFLTRSTARSLPAAKLKILSKTSSGVAGMRLRTYSTFTYQQTWPAIEQRRWSPKHKQSLVITHIFILYTQAHLQIKSSGYNQWYRIYVSSILLAMLPTWKRAIRKRLICWSSTPRPQVHRSIFHSRWGFVITHCIFSQEDKRSSTCGLYSVDSQGCRLDCIQLAEVGST